MVLKVWSCAQCAQSYDTKAQRDQHVQLCHQTFTTANFPNGESVTLQRDINTHRFTCPKCERVFIWPKAVQLHISKRCMNVKKAQIHKPRQAIRGPSNSTTFLDKFNLLVNKDVGVLICKTCQICIGHDVQQVVTHLSRLHKIESKYLPSGQDINSSLQSTEFLSESEIRMFPSEYPETVSQVEGLPVYRDGLMCDECKFMCVCERTMKRHLKKHESANVESVCLQTFFKGPRKKFFRVSSDSSSSNESGPNPESVDFVGLELHQFSSFIDGIKSSAAEEQVIPTLLQKFKWHVIMARHAKCSCSAVIQMCKLPRVTVGEMSNVETNCRAAVAAYFQFGTKLITSAPYLMRRKIKVGSTCVRDSHKGFSGVEDIQGNYQRHMIRLLYMIRRCNEMKEIGSCAWDFATNPTVDTAVMDLFSLCDTDKFDEFSRPVISQMQRVMEEIYISESLLNAPEQHSNYDFQRYSLYRYVVAASITGGDWNHLEMLEVNNITSICAAFIYWARLFVLVSTLEPQYCPNGVSGDNLLEYIQDGRPTAFNAILEIMKVGKHLTGPAEGQRPIGYWLDAAKTTYLIKTVVVTKRKLQNLAEYSVRQLKHLLQWRILRGFDTSAVRRQIDTFEFTDLINFRALGQWFLNRPENQLKVTPTDFIAYLLSSGSMNMSGYQYHWDPRKLQEWMSECDDFMDLFLFTVHLTFGQPSRASEWATLRIRDSNLAFRSVFAIRNRFTFLSNYHKSKNVTGKFKPIARFAPLMINADIILYLYLVRPVQAYFAQIGNPDSLSENYFDSVFLKKGTPMDAEQIRACIAKCFAAFSDMKLDVSTYRHVATAFMEVYVRPGLTTTDLLDEQAGHSHQTANTVYARSANDPSSLTRDQLEKFWNASREWHFFLNLEKRSTQSVDISRIDCTLPPTNQTSICFQSDEPFTPRIEKLTFLRLANSQTQRDVEPSKISPYAFANAKQVVEKFIGDGNATFTSVEQGVAIATLLSLPHCHRLIVLPTGGGKSLLYMAPYIADPRYKKTSLVIVPSVALLNESVTKCNVKGVSSCKFSQKLVTSSEQYCLIFAAAEQIKLESFRNYFSMQVNTKRTNMIFVDEAHLVATASCYRPDMLFVPTLVSLGIPLTLLSATIPPYLTRELTTMFHANFDVIRASTNRSNLVYRVKIVSDLQNEVAATMKFKQESLSDNRTRFIAYCMTRKEVDEIWDTLTKTSMSVSRYHSKMTSTEQSKSVAQWKKGFHKWMLATSAFGVGIDYPHVRLVLHVGSTYSIIDYAQETGRAGRDGLTSDALVLTTRNFQYSRPNIQQGEQSKHFQEVNKFLLDKTQCRRQYLQTIIDGNGVPCLADITNRMCDFCQSTEHRPTCNENPEMISENIVEAGQHARVLNANTRIIQGEICCFLNRLPVGFCAICWVRGHQNHTGKSVCPWLQGSCFKCQQSGHGSRSCNFVPNFPNGTCFFCGLPWIDVAGIGSMHHPHNYVNCTHPAKGVVIAACWATFHAREFDDIPVDATEFVAWLPSTSSICQFSNLVVLFSKLLQIKGA